MKQPNILYIHSHDTGRYLQPYGHAIPTPRHLALYPNEIRGAVAAALNPAGGGRIVAQILVNAVMWAAHRNLEETP